MNNIKNLTFWQIIAMNTLSSSTTSDWFNAVERGDITTIKEMIATHAGARTEKGETALMMACRMNNPDIVSILLPLEIDIYTDKNEDALIFAAQSGSYKILALLLAYTSIRRATTGFTALDIAIQRDDAPSLRILLRHPSLALEDLQCAYDNMVPTTSEPVQQLLLASLCSKGVLCELKKQSLTAENSGISPDIPKSDTSPNQGLELSLTPNISIWDASTVEHRANKNASRFLDAIPNQHLSGIEEETTCSMSFLQNIQVINSESSSCTYDCDNTTNTNHNSLLSDNLTTSKNQRYDDVTPDVVSKLTASKKTEHTQTECPVFTEAEMTEKNRNIESLRTEVFARQHELEEQQRQNEEQASVFVSRIESLEGKLMEMELVHSAKMEKLQKEISSLQTINSSLGEEIAMLCQSTHSDSVSNLLATAQQLVKSEVPSINIIDGPTSTSNTRTNSMHSKISNIDSIESPLKQDKQTETDAIAEKYNHQSQVISALRAEIAQRDDQIKSLKRQNEEMKKSIQNYENSMSLYNSTVDSLIQSPHILNPGLLLQNTPHTVAGTGAATNKSKSPTPVRKSVMSPQPVTRVDSKGRGNRTNIKTPPPSRHAEKIHTVVSPASTSTLTSTKSTIHLGLKSHSARPSNVSSPRIQSSPTPKNTRKMLDMTPSREREETKSPLSDDWMLVAAKNRASSKRWSTHTPLMDAVLFRHNQDIARHMEYVGCALTNGYTALMFACERDNKGAVSILAPLECGMCLDNGDTALILALRSEHFETAELLRGLESSYCTIQNVRQLATDVVEYRTPKKNSRTDMMKYAIEGDVLKIFCLLPHQSREKDEDGNTSLIHAVSNNNLSAVKLLCTTEAGLHNKKGETALIRATKNGNLECCLILAEHEKRRQDNKGYTALMWAAVSGNAAMVRLLAPYEAGVQNAHDDNCTALMYAVEFQNFECAEILVSKEKTLEDTRGLSALERLKRYSGSSNPQLRSAFMSLLS